MALISPMQDDKPGDCPIIDRKADCISDLHDECLACIFQFLSSSDSKLCFLICRRELRIEGQCCYWLSLIKSPTYGTCFLLTLRHCDKARSQTLP